MIRGSSLERILNSDPVKGKRTFEVLKQITEFDLLNPERSDK